MFNLVKKNNEQQATNAATAQSAQSSKAENVGNKASTSSTVFACGNKVKRVFKYAEGSGLSAFAVSTMLYKLALAFAPFTVAANNQFFL